MMDMPKITRCAIYTRKSVEQGLDMKYNSIDAQRDLCEQFVKAHAAEGWVVLPTRYDDGGFSGKDLNRPAITKLLEDCRAGKVDRIVVYRFDRLARSVFSFAKLNNDLESWGVAFSSLSEQFDTSTPMGKLMLTFAIACAQWERESIAGRIKDKIVQSRKMGVWTGGPTPYGYKLVRKELVRDEETAPTVEWVFGRYEIVRSAMQVAAELSARGILRKNGRPWISSHVYTILRNPVYAGRIKLHGEVYPARHEALIEPERFDRIQGILRENAPKEAKGKRAGPSAPPLVGILRCGHCGGAMTTTYSASGTRHYYYYKCSKDSKRGVKQCPIGSVAASEIEPIVFREVGRVLTSEAFAETMRGALGRRGESICAAMENFGDFWDTLFPIERTRILHHLVKEVVITTDGADIVLKTNGIEKIAEELLQ